MASITAIEEVFFKDMDDAVRVCMNEEEKNGVLGCDGKYRKKRM